MERSHLRNQDQVFLQFDDNGSTHLIKGKDIKHKQGNSYRKVHYSRQDNLGLGSSNRHELFTDRQFPIGNQMIDNIDPNIGRVVYRRLAKLYSRSRRPAFFPDQRQSLIRVRDPHAVPYFLTEINLFPPSHYKSLFITQDYAQNGLYHLIFNRDGRFETEVVDDWIPVYEQTQQPIWGMDLNHPWQLILLKLWAKISGGYINVKNGRPFDFIETFTNSNWKYFNLAREGHEFLRKYTGKQHLGKFICKTKVAHEVRDSGMVEGSVGYELMGIKHTGGNNFVITVRSTLKNKWTGGLSVVDRDVNQHYNAQDYAIRLERDFLMNEKDFLNLFTGVYIASLRDKHDYYSQYYLLDFEPNRSRAVYLEFFIDRPGFLDFVIKQFRQNTVPFSSDRSRIEHQTRQKGHGQHRNSQNVIGVSERYVKSKFMLVYDHTYKESHPYQFQDKYETIYSTPKFSVYETDYTRGYSRGDAYFIDTVPGRYLLKIKMEKLQRPMSFVVNYASNCNFLMREVDLNKDESSLLTRQAMVSMISRTPRATLDKIVKKDQVAFGNHFDSIGYGFIAVRSARDNVYDILVDIDPELLEKEGYRLKNQYKSQRQPFGIIVRPGESNAIALKRIAGMRDYHWPPRGVAIFKDGTARPVLRA